MWTTSHLQILTHTYTHPPSFITDLIPLPGLHTFFLLSISGCNQLQSGLYGEEVLSWQSLHQLWDSSHIQGCSLNDEEVQNFCGMGILRDPEALMFLTLLWAEGRKIMIMIFWSFWGENVNLEWIKIIRACHCSGWCMWSSWMWS